ncbi:carbohydrate ABC transporter permease [Nitriliruptoraceae bacterium ZYF776]|nr:carbohydrate ABC transporter permease [Profundirhabdus halotolerans]
MTRYRLRTFGLELTMIAVTALFAFPIYVLLNLSFRQRGDLGAPLVPTTSPTLANYGDAWTEAQLGPAILNSAIVTVVSVTVLVLVGSMAAYALARATSRLSKGVFALVMVGLLLPFQLGLIPLYLTVRDLGLLGSVWSLALFYSGLQVPLTVFLYVGFIRALPRDFEEAALLDGSGPWQAFRHVVFPLLRPITGTVIIINTVFIWNDFLTPLLYLSGSTQQTIPVAIYGFVGQYITRWEFVFAGLVIGIAPVLAAYFLMQKHVIRGFAGGLKG